jgi:hypothetical protein
VKTPGESGQAYARLIPLSSFALEMCQLAIESAADQTETIPASNLRASLDKEWNQTVNPMLLHLGWEAAEGLVFFQGGRLEGHSVFFSADRLLDEAGISPTFSFWSEPEARVTSYQINLDLPAWQEYTLRRAFAEICEQALLRYEQITGRAIVDSIVRSLILYTSRQSLEINMAARHVINQEFFSTPQAGAEVYRALLKIMLDQVSQIIGSKLSLSIISDVTAGLRFDEFKVARDFSILPYELFRADKLKDVPNA